MLRYLAATALLQEVTLLSRYVTDKIQAPGDQAFLVRLQLAVMPNRRGMPYDVLTDITLHAGDEQLRAQLAPLVPRSPACGAGQYDTLNIVPMVVTDNLEGLQASRSSDIARQIGLSLLGTVQGIGASGSFARTTNLLRATQGNDANSLLTVAKLADDTVRVRLGAVQSPTYRYATLPRTHNISLLVIYRPCRATAATPAAPETATPRTTTAITRTTFRDAMSGAALPYEDTSRRLYRQMQALRSKYPGHLSYLEFARLYQWANRQDRESFFGYMDRKALRTGACGGGIMDAIAGVRRYPDDPALLRTDDPSLVSLREDTAGAGLREQVVQDGRPSLTPECRELSVARYRIIAAGLWTDLISARPMGEFAFTRIPLTLRTTDRRFPPVQTALVSYGKSETVAPLPQGQDLIGLQKVRAALVERSKGLSIAAIETGISADGTAVSAKFPSLERFGDQKATSYELELAVEGYGDDAPCDAAEQQLSPPQCARTYPVVLHNSAPSATSPYFIAATASGIIASHEGRGRLNVTVTQKGTDPFSQKLFLRIEGAELNRIEVLRGGGYESRSEGWRITSAGELTPWLENLIPNQVVKVSLVASDTLVPGTVEKSVTAAQPTKSGS